ncbi:MAG: amino acid transport protein [Acidobacteriia bacterium]|nr:amino acid transport protein [Terriglobia bacterium]
MNLDPAWLFLSLITGAIGLALFVYGKRNARWPQIVIGLLFMVYPYFTTSISSLVIVGVFLSGVLWYLLRTGR